MSLLDPTEEAPKFALTQGYTGASKTFILEMSEDCLALVGQALHLYMQVEKTDSLALKTINQLIDQVSCVYMDPTQHKVYPSSLQAPLDCSLTVPVAYSPLGRKY